jgi:inorganic phosphate transporter, PiT family
MLTIVIITIVIALAYDFLNGMNDAANSIATIVSTRVLSPRNAVLWAAFFNFAAMFLFGTHVADTIGKIINPKLVDQYLVITGLSGALIWVYFCTHFGLPISVSHALIGGMLGPALFKYGLYENGELVFHGEKIFKTFIFIFLAPLIGMLVGYLIMVLTLWFVRKKSPQKVDNFFRVMQLVSSAAFSLGHGGNDAQKVMGIITVLLFSTGYIPAMEVPFWVVILCYTTIGMGTLVGGWKVIRTLGVGLTHLKPIGGFCAETAGAITLFGTGFAGIPASTTHTVTGAIMGVGVTKRFSAVRWGVANNIVAAWMLTIPAACAMSALVYFLVSFFI